MFCQDEGQRSLDCPSSHDARSHTSGQWIPASSAPAARGPGTVAGLAPFPGGPTCFPPSGLSRVTSSRKLSLILPPLPELGLLPYSPRWCLLGHKVVRSLMPPSLGLPKSQALGLSLRTRGRGGQTPAGGARVPWTVILNLSGRADPPGELMEAVDAVSGDSGLGDGRCGKPALDAESSTGRAQTVLAAGCGMDGQTDGWTEGRKSRWPRPRLQDGAGLGRRRGSAGTGHA